MEQFDSAVSAVYIEYMSGSNRKRGGRWRTVAVRLLFPVLAFLLAAALALVVNLPLLAEWLISQKLGAAGFTAAHLKVTAASTHQLVIEDICLTGPGDGERLYCDRLVLTYALRELFQQKMRQMTIAGLRCRVAVDHNGHWTVNGMPLATAGAQATTPPSDLPITLQSLVIRQSHVRLHATDRFDVDIPVELEVQGSAASEYRFTARLMPLDVSLLINGRFDMESGHGRISIESRDLAARQVMAVLAAAGIAVPAAWPHITAAGDVRASADIRQWRLAEVDGSLTVDEALLSMAPEAFCRLTSLRVSARATEDLRNPNFNLTAHVPLLCWQRVTASGMDVHIRNRSTNAVDVALSSLAFNWDSRLSGSADLLLSLTAPWAVSSDQDGFSGMLTTSGLAWQGVPLGPVQAVAHGNLGQFHVELTAPPERTRGFGLERVELQGNGAVWPRPSVEFSGEINLRLEALPTVELLTVTPVDGELLSITGRLQAGYQGGAGWRCAGNLTVPPQGLAVTDIKGVPALTLAARTGLAMDFVLADTDVEAYGELRMEAPSADAGTGRGRAASAVLKVESLHLPAARIIGRWRESSNGAPQDEKLLVSGTFELDGGSVTAGEDVSAEGVKAALPFSLESGSGFSQLRPAANNAGAEKGTLHIERVAAYGLAMQRFDGDITLFESGLRVNGQGRLGDLGASLLLEHDTVWAEGIKTRTKLQLPSLPLAGDDPWYRQLTGQADLTLKGEIAAACSIATDMASVKAQGKLELKGVDLKLEERDIHVQGIVADIGVADLLAFRTAPHQQIRFDAAEIGTVPFGSGMIAFQLESPSDVFLEQCMVNWLGGEIRTHAVRFQLPAPDFDLVLYADRIDLQEVMHLLKGFDGRAQGTLYGKLPLFVRKGKLGYGNGFLYSVPGQGGSLNIQNADFLGNALAQTSEQHERMQMAAAALRNFAFDLFRIDLVPSAGEGSKPTLNLAGRSRTEGVSVPLDLTVNVHGPLDQILNMGLRLRGTP